MSVLVNYMEIIILSIKLNPTSMRNYMLFLYKKWLLKMLAIFVCICFTLASNAQGDTIRLQQKKLLTERLKPGLKQYLVYFQDPKNSSKINASLWLREVNIGVRNNQKVFTITQHWISSDSSAYRTVYSVNRKSDFLPLFHRETILGKTKAYNWSKENMIGADSVNGNLQIGFKLNFDSPNFNWNLDIETFEMLPLANRKTFVINFYDAGRNLPQYITYKVIGSETIATLDNHNVDCWKLFTEGQFGDKQHFSETYWISKKEHEFLKEEDAYSGIYRYKIKMMGAATDLLKRFINH
jgi:hypothetical protein